MLRLLHPELHGYEGADLDENGQPYKITADVLEIVHYVIDGTPSPQPALTVTFARVDPRNNYVQAGPVTQHWIVGLELIEVMSKEGGVSIDVIEDSVLKTGMPASHIRPEDIEKYALGGPTADWATRFIDLIKRRMERMKQAESQLLPVPPISFAPPQK